MRVFCSVPPFHLKMEETIQKQVKGKVVDGALSGSGEAGKKWRRRNVTVMGNVRIFVSTSLFLQQQQVGVLCIFNNL